MTALRAILITVHLAVTAAWLGAMLYSLAVVQPRAERFLGGAQRYEDFAATLAAGARWKVLGLVATLALSGGGLVAVEAVAQPGLSTLWIGLVAAKAALLVVATALFAHVTWRLWPARVFALPAEVPGLKRRFRVVALALTALVGTGLVLGAIADAVR